MVDSVEVGRGHITLDVDDRSLQRGLESARQSFSSWAQSIGQGILQGLGQQLFTSITNGLGAAVGAMQQSVQDASNLTESINKLGVAFGDSADEMLAWSRTSAEALGQSQQQALEAASSFGLMFRSMGVGGDQAVEMSKSLVQLASDLASINNIGVDEALQKLRAGLIGEAEPLRAVGVLLSETAVRQKAVQMGLAATTEAVTDQEKVMARYQLILDQTVLAQGDFARTSDELANSQRILSAQISDASASFGQALLPVQLAFTRGLSELITLVAPYGMRIMDSLAAGLADGIIAILPVLAQLRTLFTYWLEPGSPPRLLPDLEEWGAEAMQVYLDSWSNADFDSLKQMGSVIEQILRSFVASGKIDETDLVERVFGSQDAILGAIAEFHNLGVVSQNTLQNIARAAGPAGDAIGELVGQYFELQRAAGKVADAQDELNDVTQKYADALRPINDQLDAVRGKQDEIRDNQRLQALGKELTDPTKTVDERQLARLEIQQIELEKQAHAIENERDTAVDASKAKISAAQKEEDAAQAKFNVAQAAIDQQVKTNSLVAEEIALRNRLADEAMAAQEQAERELTAQQREDEAADRERMAELERIYNAQLAFRLATTDTAGQLAILQDELANTVEGSAEYYQILTRIAGLQEKLKKEGESGGGLMGAVTGGGEPGGALQKASEGIEKLSEALKQAFDTLSGKDQGKVELNPFFAGIVTLIGDIAKAAEDAKPIIQGFIDLFTGKSADVPTADILRPTESSGGMFGAILGGMRNLLSVLTLIKNGEWTTLWNDFKANITEFLGTIDPEADPETFGFYAFLVNNLIPAIDALRVGEWRRAWTDLGGEAVEAFAAGIVNSKSGKTMQKLSIDLINKDGLAFIRDIGELFGGGGESNTPATPEVPGPELKGPEGDLNWEEIWRQAIRDMLKGMMPGVGPLIPQPQSFASPGGGGAPYGTGLTPVMAASNITTGGDTVVFNIEQNIASSGDFGGARSGAEEGIRQALLTRKLSTT